MTTSRSVTCQKEAPRNACTYTYSDARSLSTPGCDHAAATSWPTWVDSSKTQETIGSTAKRCNSKRTSTTPRRVTNTILPPKHAKENYNHEVTHNNIYQARAWYFDTLVKDKSDVIPPRQHVKEPQSPDFVQHRVVHKNCSPI
jgi:hypothetical protein